MLAVAFMEFGGPEVLRVMEIESPVADAGEVVVRVVASTVNPTDTLMRSGLQATLMSDLFPPYVAGMEFAGYVHDIGEGTTPLKIGQPVMGIVNARRHGGGSHAQHISVPASSLAPLEHSIDLVEAATVPMNGLTAMMALEALALPPGKTVLVTGAAGTVGGYSIELAKHAGLTVIADASENDVDLIHRLGADEVVPRGDAMNDAVQRLSPDGVDGLIDGALLGQRANPLVRDGGTVVSLRRSHVAEDPRLVNRYVAVTEHVTDTAALVSLSKHLSEGILTPRIAFRLPMTEAAQAHRLVERGGLRGRAVLMFDDPPE